MYIFNRSKGFLRCNKLSGLPTLLKKIAWSKKNEKFQTCQSSSSVAIFSCSNLVSRYNCKLSGAERSGRSRWSRYLLRLAKWFLMISQSLLNSVVLLYCLQNWKARWAVICMWQWSLDYKFDITQLCILNYCLSNKTYKKRRWKRRISWSVTVTTYPMCQAIKFYSLG